MLLPIRFYTVCKGFTFVFNIDFARIKIKYSGILFK